MRFFSIDFKSRILYVETETRKGFEQLLPEISLDKLQDLAPIRITLEADGCYSWNFDERLFIINKKISHSNRSTISSKDFVPIEVIRVPNLAEYYYIFLSKIGYFKTEPQVSDEDMEALFYELALDEGGIS